MIDRQTSADIEVIKEKLLGFDHTRKSTPAILSVQETKSWDIPNLELKRFVCYGNKHGYAKLLVSEKFAQSRGRGKQGDVRRYSSEQPW